MRKVRSVSRRRGLSDWGRLVVLSGVLVALVVVALAIASAATRETVAATSTVRGTIEGVVVEAGDGDVEIQGGGERSDLSILRTDRWRYGHRPQVRRTVRDGIVRLAAGCPTGPLAPCGADWRLVVPQNVPVTVRTGDGDVRVREFRGSVDVTTGAGGVALEDSCGFSLQVRTRTGDVVARTTCAAERLSLRSTDGDVHATVPTGRYRLDAESEAGSSSVRGITAAEEGPFQLQALSRTGDVEVEGRR